MGLGGAGCDCIRTFALPSTIFPRSVPAPQRTGSIEIPLQVSAAPGAAFDQKHVHPRRPHKLTDVGSSAYRPCRMSPCDTGVIIARQVRLREKLLSQLRRSFRVRGLKCAARTEFGLIWRSSQA